MLAQIWFHVPLFLPEGHMHTFAHHHGITILLSFSHICMLIITSNFLTVHFNLCLASSLRKYTVCGADNAGGFHMQTLQENENNERNAAGHKGLSNVCPEVVTWNVWEEKVMTQKRRTQTKWYCCEMSFMIDGLQCGDFKPTHIFVSPCCWVCHSILVGKRLEALRESTKCIFCLYQIHSAHLFVNEPRKLSLF